MVALQSVLLASIFANGVGKPILLPPVGNISSTTALLVWVPGGLVPNTYYVPLMQELQNELQGKLNLWVSIPDCPGNLCIPMVSSVFVRAALKRGQSASGVERSLTWMGGHSLGAAEAESYCRHNNGAQIGGGCVLMGGYAATTTGGGSVEHMLKYPVPLLQLVAELDFGSARLTKMAPFYQWAEAGGKAQLARTPVVLVPDVDHSDMCEGFPVEGDLPSAVEADVAIKRLAAPTAAFMAQHILQDPAAAASMEKYLNFTKSVMDPINEAFTEERGPWCEELQKVVAGPLASKIRSLSTTFGKSRKFRAPRATLSESGDAVNIVLISTGTYGGQWPVGPGASDKLTAAHAPAVNPSTASSLGCRVVSRTALAKLLKEADSHEPENACRTVNEKALAWGFAHAPERTIERYHDSTPCNKCAKAVSVQFMNDTKISGKFKKATLNYTLDEFALTVTSPSLVARDEYSCMLLSPARVVDFLMLDAFSASRYGPPTDAVLV